MDKYKMMDHLDLLDRRIESLEEEKAFIMKLEVNWRKRAEHAESALAESRQRVEELTEALRFQDPRNATERYDRIADDFERETGMPAPGRSRPPEMGGGLFTVDEEGVQKAWRAFVNAWHERWFDRALSTGTPEGGSNG